MKKKLLALSVTVFVSAAVFAQLSVSFIASPPTCSQPCSGSLTAVVNGGLGTPTFTWSNQSSDATITDLCSGTYSVTIFDADECRASDGYDCSATNSYTFPPAEGNISCSVISVPNGNIATTGGDPNTLYLGYGPQSTKLSVSVSGAGPFTYSWVPASGLSCTDCASPVFTPSAQGFYFFTVIVSNGSCSSQCSISICVLDIRASSGGSGSNGNGHQNGTGNGNLNKVYVCHLPPGNPANVQTICISVNAVPAHVPLHGGDHLGSCNQSCNSDKTDETIPELLPDPNQTGLDVLVYPNPFSSSFQINIESSLTDMYDVKLYDVTGKLVEERKEVNPRQELILGNNLSKGIYFAQIRQGNATRNIHLEKVE